MNNYMNKLYQDENPDALIEYIDRMDEEQFSLVTLIDSLVPTLVWENSLRFGNFHMVKMSLFIRNMARRNLFSVQTERALAKLILRHLFHINWLKVSADTVAYVPVPVGEPIEKMLTEIEKSNAHNAYFYAASALNKDRDQLFNALMKNGAVSIPDTIGHSISCFYPVLEQVLSVDHPAAGTSLLSLILYLCRFRNSSDSLTEATSLSDEEKNHLLAQASSGTSIVDVHQMITFYTMHAWERASWNKGVPPSWKFLINWVGDKQVDETRVAYTVRFDDEIDVNVPESYEALRDHFDHLHQKAFTDSSLAILDESYEKACDWLFRLYAEQYTPDWDPHYITSLFAALELSHDESIPKDVSRMAVVQALEYFLGSI